MLVRVYFLCIFGSIIFSNGVIAQEQDYIWPTNASQHLTSTFGETRSGHYHSGIDIKTWGKEGYKVFASKDGVIHRIAISEKGYGKVIYIKHIDGSFTVYAHLQRFRKDLQSYVDSIRMSDYTFEIDLNVEHLNIAVSQGDVIGFTGSTGVGPPHLHFETRRSDETPFNPLLTNLTVTDFVGPTLSALMVFPLSDSSLIRGLNYPQLYYPFKNEENEIEFGPIDASGPIGLAISTFDEANGVTNKYAVYELGLIQAEDTIFYEKIKSFSFDEDDLMLNDRLSAFGASRRSYQTLFKKDGPNNPFYEIVDERSNIQLIDSTVRFTLFANDYFSNKTYATITVSNSLLSSNQNKTSIPKPIHNWYWTENWVQTGEEALLLKQPTFGKFWNTERSERLATFFNSPILFSRLNPEISHTITTPDNRLKIRFSKNSFFDSLSIASSHSELDGLPYISIHPGMIPSRKEFEIQFYLEDFFEKNKKYRLFRYDRSRDKVTYVDSKLIGRTIFGYPSDLGEFLVIPDSEPPTLQAPILIKTEFGKWFINIKTKDNLTGIDFESTKIFVNGVRGIVEYDNEENLLIYYHPDFIPEEKNTLTVLVSDKAGNQIKKVYQL